MNFRSDIQNPHQVTKFSLVGLSCFVHLMGSISGEHIRYGAFFMPSRGIYGRSARLAPGRSSLAAPCPPYSDGDPPYRPEEKFFRGGEERERGEGQFLPADCKLKRNTGLA